MNEFLKHLDDEGYFEKLAVPKGVVLSSPVQRTTTVVGLLSEEGVVLCADSQATDGRLDRVPEPVRKLFCVAPNAILGVAGLFGPAQSVARIMEASASYVRCMAGIEPSAEELELLLRDVLVRFAPLTAAFGEHFTVQCLLGVAGQRGSLAFVDPVGTLLTFEETGYYAIGSGAIHALGYLEAKGYRPDGNLDGALRAGLGALTRAAKVNSATGAPFVVAIADCHGSRFIASEEIAAALETLEEG